MRPTPGFWEGQRVRLATLLNDLPVYGFLRIVQPFPVLRVDNPLEHDRMHDFSDQTAGPDEEKSNGPDKRIGDELSHGEPLHIIAKGFANRAEIFSGRNGFGCKGVAEKRLGHLPMPAFFRFSARLCSAHNKAAASNSLPLIGSTRITVRVEPPTVTNRVGPEQIKRLSGCQR